MFGYFSFLNNTEGVMIIMEWLWVFPGPLFVTVPDEPLQEEWRDKLDSQLGNFVSYSQQQTNPKNKDTIQTDIVRYYANHP